MDITNNNNAEKEEVGETAGGTSETAATPPASSPSPQLPAPPAAGPVAEKESESKEKIQAVRQIGGDQREGQEPTDGEEVPQAEPPAIEELEDNLPDPELVLRRSSRTKAPKRHAYDEGY